MHESYSSDVIKAIVADLTMSRRNRILLEAVNLNGTLSRNYIWILQIIRTKSGNKISRVGLVFALDDYDCFSFYLNVVGQHDSGARTAVPLSRLNPEWRRLCAENGGAVGTLHSIILPNALL
jgi:hypothetical protein